MFYNRKDKEKAATLMWTNTKQYYQTELNHIVETVNQH